MKVWYRNDNVYAPTPALTKNAKIARSTLDAAGKFHTKSRSMRKRPTKNDSAAIKWEYILKLSL